MSPATTSAEGHLLLGAVALYGDPRLDAQPQLRHGVAGAIFLHKAQQGAGQTMARMMAASVQSWVAAETIVARSGSPR
jgi:hypothetical protein